MTSVLIVTPRFHHWPQALASHDALDTPCAVARLSLVEGDTDPNPYVNITGKYERGRQMALELGYDALLCLEDDMIVPPDALARLLAVDADIVYGLTVWRHGRPGWSTRLALTADGQAVNLSDYPDEARARWGTVVDVAGTGTFCTLIRRRVFEALPWRVDPAWPTLCCDWWLSVDAQRLGFRQRADLGCVCGHITREPTPRVLWPDARQARLWRVELL